VRILHVIASLAPRYGGPSVACPALCRELARLGHQVSIYTTNVDGDRCAPLPLDRLVLDRGVEIRYFSGWTRPHEFKFSPSLWAALARHIPTFDLVHIYSLYGFSSTAAAHLCRRFQVPYVLHPHGSLDPFLLSRHALRKRIYSTLFEYRNFRYASSLVFNSHEELRLAAPWLDRFLPRAKEHPLREVVPVGVEDECFASVPPAARQLFLARFPELRKKQVILFFGRLSFKKGLDLLAQAFIELARSAPRAHLLVAGPDTEGLGQKLRHWLSDGKVLEKATFTGTLHDSARFAALQLADVFVLPSYSENFGQSVAEAMASSVPVVISNKVNIWPEVQRVGAGVVVPCDSAETARAILTLLRNPARAKEMGRQGCTWASRNLTWLVVGVQMEALYRGLTKNSRAQHVSSAITLGRRTI